MTTRHANMKIEKIRDGLLLKVHVKPRAKSFEIEVTDNELVVACTQPPIGGKANRELLKKLSKLFGRVEIVSGFHSNTKTILLQDAVQDDVAKILKRIRRGGRD